MTMPTMMQIVLASLTSLKLKSQGETMISTAISGSIMAWVFGEIGRRIENSLSLLTGSGSASPLDATFRPCRPGSDMGGRQRLVRSTPGSVYPDLGAAKPLRPDLP